VQYCSFSYSGTKDSTLTRLELEILAGSRLYFDFLRTMLNKKRDGEEAEERESQQKAQAV